VYNLFIFFLKKAILIGAFLNFKKARRRNEIILNQNNLKNTSPNIWCHCASAGEFEQVVPLLKNLKNKTKLPLTVSFFSPSGYDFHRNNKLIDRIILLPIDTKQNSKKIITLINPAFCIWVKKEFWKNLLKEIKQNNYKNYLVNYNGNERKTFFYTFFEQHQLQYFEHIFQTNEIIFPKPNITISKNTKWDSVKDLVKNKLPFENISNWTNNQFTIILGSCWEQEIGFVSEFKKRNLNVFNQIRWIFAPHNIENQFTNKNFSDFNPVLYNSNELSKNNNCLLINKLGILKFIYQYSHLSIIGGGFKDGIHNILEPATYGFPILFGPNHSKFEEAEVLIKKDLGIVIHNYSDFEKHTLSYFNRYLKNDLKSINFIETFADQLNSSEEIGTIILNSFY
jgi:3-deoxy-D-manno-octulosonic-acid transferase